MLNQLLGLLAPNGLRITGTLEALKARGDVYGFSRSADGTLTPRYTGATEIFWDEQRTVLGRHGNVVVLDADGNEWPIDACMAFGPADPP